MVINNWHEKEGHLYMKKIGRIIVSIKGLTLTEVEKAMLKHSMIAGAILFPENYKISSDFKDKTQLRLLLDEIRNIADKPCFIDHEGGYVQRFGRGFEALPAPRVLGKAYDLNNTVGKNLAQEYGAIMAEQLVELGIISLAPVCDLDGGNAVISRLNRAFHSEPQACIELLLSFIAGMHSKGMQATGKHFPGHGQASGDTHINIVSDNRSLAELESKDLSVFIGLIKANKLAAIMPSHIIYTEVDPNNTAGSSKIWLQDILRDKYGYKGIIVSDCLSMTGSGDGSLFDKTKHALDFGDVAILCHQEPETVISLCDQLAESGYALSKEGQERFSRWTQLTVNASSNLVVENSDSALFIMN
jgi:beta-N-acetylhexosaminidase